MRFAHGGKRVHWYRSGGGAEIAAYAFFSAPVPQRSDFRVRPSISSRHLSVGPGDLLRTAITLYALSRSSQRVEQRLGVLQIVRIEAFDKSRRTGSRSVCVASVVATSDKVVTILDGHMVDGHLQFRPI
jgi:hypothetical protein